VSPETRLGCGAEGAAQLKGHRHVTLFYYYATTTCTLQLLLLCWLLHLTVVTAMVAATVAVAATVVVLCCTVAECMHSVADTLYDRSVYKVLFACRSLWMRLQ
jgi:hypothetical protein